MRKLVLGLGAVASGLIIAGVASWIQQGRQLASFTPADTGSSMAVPRPAETLPRAASKAAAEPMPADPGHPGLAPRPPLGTDVQPWAGNPSSPSSELPAGAGTSPKPVQGMAAGQPTVEPLSEDKIRALQSIQQRLLALQKTPGAMSPAAVDTLLGELVEVHGSPVVQGIDMDALRSNLRIAGAIQEAAEQLKRLSEQPGEVDKAKAQALMARIQTLQSQMRTDIQAQ